MMRTTILFIKGILLYTTMISIVLFICSIDSLSMNNILISLIIIVGLLFASFKYISEEDLKTLSGHNLFKGDDICKGL